MSDDPQALGMLCGLRQRLRELDIEPEEVIIPAVLQRADAYEREQDAYLRSLKRKKERA